MLTLSKKQAKDGGSQVLNHFVKLNYLVGILKNREITLTDPSKWEDKNDVFLIDKYKQRTNCKSFFAICFLSAPETYHHWKIYAGEYGACIEFSRDKIVQLFKMTNDCKIKQVKYWGAAEIKEKIKDNKIDFDELPFIKRPAYSGEKEMRGIFVKKDDVAQNNFRIGFGIECISKITISPWVSDVAYDEIKSAIIGYGYSEGVINHSKLLHADFWQNSFDPL